MSERDITCFFSGHRILPNENRDIIADILQNEIIKKYNAGVRNFISGGATGFDMLAGAMIVSMKKNSFPDMKLWLYIPCYDYGENWVYEKRVELNSLKCNADRFEVITKKKYSIECIRVRNERMVSDSKFGIGYKTTNHSGTGQTFAIAKRQGIDMVNIADII